MSDFRSQTRDMLHALVRANSDDAPGLTAKVLTEESAWDVAHPVNELRGSAAVEAGFFAPLRAALAHVYRRDEIFIGGDNIRDEGGRWVASVCHYVGRFVAPLWGVLPSDRMVFLRAGEFYRIEDDGRISQARIIVDLPDLMRQAGRFPLPRMLGTEMLFPAPETHDGVLPQAGDGAASISVVQAMLSDLHVYDPETGESHGQTGKDGYWYEDMMWYGPAGIGSNHRWTGFVDHHRAAFLNAFPDRKGGNHYCRFGDGNFAAISGWPSMTMTHKGDYLGVPATGKPLTLRVMDFYRIAGRQIAENWVLLDYGHLFHQMGVDLFAKSAAIEPHWS